MARCSVGLIGCGAIAQAAHIPILAHLAGVQLIALCDTDPSRLAAARLLAPRASPFETADALLACEAIDAVVIALPTAAHAACAISAFDMGKHVYLEKPIAINLADGAHVVAAWERSQRVGMIGFNYRFNRLHQDTARLVARGTIGRVLEVRTTFTTAPRELPAWKKTRNSGGGVLLDLASHHVDLVRFLIQDEIVEVRAEVQSLRSECDTARLTFRLSGGTVVESYFAFAGIEEDRIEIRGELGSLVVDRYRSLGVERPELQRNWLGGLKRLARVGAGARHFVDKLRSQLNEPSFRIALETFVHAVRTGSRITPNLHDGLRSLGVILAAEESAHLGHSVTVQNALSSAPSGEPAKMC